MLFTYRIFLLTVLHLSYSSVFGQFFHENYSTDSLKRVISKIEKKSIYPGKNRDILVTYNLIATQLNKDAHFDSCILLSKRLLPQFQDLNMFDEAATAIFNIGWALQKKELYFEAVKYFEEAISASEKAKKDSLLALSHHWAGISYMDQKAYQRGLEHYKKELAICRKRQFKHQWADCTNSIGLYYFSFEKIDSAFYYFDECRRLSEENKFGIMLPIAYKNVGKCYWALGNEKKGTTYILNSIQLFSEHKNPSIRNLAMYSYIELAKYYAEKNQYTLSNQYALKGLKINQTANYTDLQQDISGVLYQNYKAVGNQSEALRYLELYQKASDKINGDFLAQQHTALDERIKSEQQKNQIFTLNQEKITSERERKWLIIGLLCTCLFVGVLIYFYRTIQKQKTEIEAINAGLEQKVQERTAELQQAYDEIKEAMLNGQSIERHRVAADLHDNLGSILSAIGMSMEAVNYGRLDENEKNIFKHIKRQLDIAYQEVRLLSHNLQPDELKKQGLKKALISLADKINQTQRIRLVAEVENLTAFSKEIEFVLYSICLELINNTLKHARATEAHISFEQKSMHHWQMKVSDNGIGLSDTAKKGFGRQSIQNRLQQIGASMEVINDNGLVYLIEIYLIG